MTPIFSGTPTPLYDGTGNFVGVQWPGCNTMTRLQTSDIGYLQFLAWLVLNNTTQALWLANNPWQSWGNMSVGQYQQQQLAQLKADCDNCILTQYPQTNQMALLMFLLAAQQSRNSAAANYVMQVWEWAAQIMEIYYSYAEQLGACTACAQIAGISWYAALTAAVSQDPGVTLLDAESMITGAASSGTSGFSGDSGTSGFSGGLGTDSGASGFSS